MDASAWETRTFDRSLLPPADFEFVVLADTHYMLDVGGRPLEFDSRHRQTARAGAALKQAAALDPAFIIHLGDLVQEFPGTTDFDRALDEALAQVGECGVDDIRFVAGNHDVGDKPDPLMPTAHVDAQALAAYDKRLGRSWYSFDRGDVHLIVLNSQIMNGPLQAARDQQAWAEADLAAHQDMRILLFLHLPLYLKEPTEASLGHYDNVGEPARSWLLDLVRRHRVGHLFAAHVHFTFYDAIDSAGGDFCRYRVVPSTSFTRPGFSHLFTGPPPPERGRDDTAKLGFYLCRVLDERIDVHLVRTNRETQETLRPGCQRLLTPVPYRSSDHRQTVGGKAPPDTVMDDTRGSAQGAATTPVDPTTPSASTSSSRGLAGRSCEPTTWERLLGITLAHPLAPVAEVPIAYPSVIRQPVRADHPLLACLELGIGAVRAPGSDLGSDDQRRRLQLLRREGVQLQIGVLWSDAPSLSRQIADYSGQVDRWEIQLPGSPRPSADCLSWLAGESRPAVSLCAVVPGEIVAGKQHPRTRIGYRVDEIPELDTLLLRHDVQVDSVLCRLDSSPAPLDTVGELKRQPHLDAVGRVDFLFEMPGQDDGENAVAAAEALFAAALVKGSKLFVGPFLDLDRTLDVGHGALDTLCNPRPVFHLLRTLNALLSGNVTRFNSDGIEVASDGIEDETLDGLRVWRFSSEEVSGVLLLPSSGGASLPRNLIDKGGQSSGASLYQLCDGTVSSVLRGDDLDAVRIHGPAFLLSGRKSVAE